MRFESSYGGRSVQVREAAEAVDCEADHGRFEQSVHDTTIVDLCDPFAEGVPVKVAAPDDAAGSDDGVGLADHLHAGDQVAERFGE